MCGIIENVENLWVGIIEHNGNEGESFGFYFPRTDETLRLISDIELNYAAIDKKWGGGDESYDFDHGISDSELAVLEKHDRNGYMSRVNRCSSEKSMIALAAAANAPLTCYKGSFPEHLTDPEDLNSGEVWHSFLG